MGKPGRRPSSSADWKLAFIQRVIDARERTGMDQATFAKELSRRSGLNVTYDKYRKYEILDPKKGSLLPHNLVAAFCDLAVIHPLVLFSGETFFPTAARPAASRRKAG
jgi:hypothetical protein